MMKWRSPASCAADHFAGRRVVKCIQKNAKLTRRKNGGKFGVRFVVFHVGGLPGACEKYETFFIAAPPPRIGGLDLCATCRFFVNKRNNVI